MPGTSDELQRVDQGWRAALALQVRVSSQSLFRAAYAVLRDASGAEDVCQQALLRAWQERDRIRDRERLGGWLLRVVVNESLALLRRRKVERRAAEVLVRAPAARGQGAAPDCQPALRDSIVAALDELPEMTRCVVVLRLMEGRSGNEVKEALGISASEVSRRLHDGIDRLQYLLAEWRGEEGK